MKFPRIVNSFLPLIIFLISSINLFVFSANAQSSADWAPQSRVPVFENEALPPYLVADQNRLVHAFTSQWVGQTNPQWSVVYSSWSIDRGWSSSVDILLSPFGQARVMGVELDQSGIMHLVFFGGDDTAASIYYSQAPGVNVGQAFSWSVPKSIAGNAITPNTAALASDKKKQLVVVYSGNELGNGVYFTFSSDAGGTWLRPEPIFLTGNDELWPYGLQLYWGESGLVHAVWNVVDTSGHNRSAYYTNLNITTRQWSQPIEFDMGIGINAGMGIANPAVIEHKGEVLLIYNNGIPPTGVPPTQWFIRSSDDGKNWTRPVRPFANHVGRNGTVSYVVDSEEKLHIIFPDRIPAETNGVYDDIGGIWHSVWTGSSWSEPQPIAQARSSIQRENERRDPKTPVFNPYDARAVIIQGNMILATWRTDPGFARNGVWFSFLELNITGLPIKTLPVPIASPPAVTPMIVSQTPNNHENPIATCPDCDENPSSDADPSILSHLVAGIGPSIIFILIILYYFHIYSFKKNIS
jgi:hypothetical protein